VLRERDRGIVAITSATTRWEREALFDDLPLGLFLLIELIN